MNRQPQARLHPIAAALVALGLAAPPAGAAVTIQASTPLAAGVPVVLTASDPGIGCDTGARRGPSG